MQLDKIFNPKTIAVIGASDTAGSVGYALMDNLINSKYAGTVYPVNNKRAMVFSKQAYKSILEIPAQIDLAIIATPAITVPQITEDCGRAQAAGAVIISAGFQEMGPEGEILTARIIATAQKYALRLIGPNCLGFMRPDIGLNASFAAKSALAGNIAFISQSGALCTAMLDWANENNVGFRYFVSIGSMADISFHDLLDYFAQDKGVASIFVYMETLHDARKFMSAARAFARTKPLVIFKSGRTAAGAQAAKSHTGAMTGNDAVFDAAFKRAGAIRADTIASFFDIAKFLAMQALPRGKRLAIITNAGGPGIIAADALIKNKGAIAELNGATIAALDAVLPANWSHNNPVDILGDADSARYGQSLAIAAKDDNADAVLVILTPQYMTNPSEAARTLASLKPEINKPVLAVWMGGNEVAEGRRILDENRIPAYDSPEEAILSLSLLSEYQNNLEVLRETVPALSFAIKPDFSASRKLLDSIIADQRTTLTEAEAKKLLANYEISILDNAIARNAQSAGIFAEKIGFPVAMKILSPDILHKTDINGVKLDINTSPEAENAFAEIIANAGKNAPDARIEGVFIEPMKKKRFELLIGCKQDRIFGPTIVFGMGGTAVEVFQDTAIDLPPLDMASALRLMAKTKIYKLLKGYRNLPCADIASIQLLLIKFSRLLADFPEIKELDINPYAADEGGGFVLDAKVVLDSACFGKRFEPYAHLAILPYPQEFETGFQLTSGEAAVIRPIKAEDKPLLGEMLKTLSQDTIRHCFFESNMENIDEFLARQTQIDYSREIALIVELADGENKKIVGFARLIADPVRARGEYAILISDPWHYRGLGKKLTDLSIEIAPRLNIKKISAKYFKSNLAIDNIFTQRGFKISALDKKINRAELDLPRAETGLC